MRDFLRKLRFGSLNDTGDENKKEQDSDNQEMRKLWSSIRALEIEYGIPPRRDRKNFGNSHN